MSNDSFVLWVDDICRQECDNVYLTNPIIDVGYLHSIESELFDKELYLPCLVRRYCETDYYQTGLFEKYMDKVLESRRYNLEEQVGEFIAWIKQHEEYGDLLLNDVYDTVQDTVKLIKDEYNMIKG